MCVPAEVRIYRTMRVNSMRYIEQATQQMDGRDCE